MRAIQSILAGRSAPISDPDQIRKLQRTTLLAVIMRGMNSLRLMIVLLCTAVCYPAAAVDPLFQSDDIVKMEIVADFSDLLVGKDKSEAHPAKLTYQTEEGPVELEVDLFLRGNFRLDFCKVPGLRVVLRRPDTGGLFDNQRKLKLVTQCKRSAVFERYLMQEYLIYRIYEILSPFSFKTRLVDVSYRDTGKRSREWDNLAFFIEDKKRLAARHEATVVEKNRIRRNQLALAETNLVSLFMYMIANTDYSMLKGEGEESCCHNLKLIDKGEGFIPIPYDFDLAGLINASYAAPPVDLGIQKVTQRLYRGFCRGNIAVPNNVEHLNENKDAIMALVDHERMKSGAVKKTRKYLEGFYKMINDPKTLERRITNRCRKQPGVNL